MPSSDLHASNSGRQSSEGTLSERSASDGAQTAMTSVLGTDEEMTEDMEEGTDEDLTDDDADLQSLHAASFYPHVQDAHRTEMPYFAAESFMANSDV